MWKRKGKGTSSVFVGCILCLLLTGSLAVLLCGCGKKYDPSGFTEAILDLQFQGETARAAEFSKDTKPSQLKQQYLNFIDMMTESFTSGLELSDAQSEDYSEKLSSLFLGMRYSVGEAKETEARRYLVPVTIEPNTTMVEYTKLLMQDSAALTGKAQQEDFADTEEMEAWIRQEIADSAGKLLEQAMGKSTYNNKETIELYVKVDLDGNYSIDDEDMDELITKILCLE